MASNSPSSSSSWVGVDKIEAREENERTGLLQNHKNGTTKGTGWSEDTVVSSNATGGSQGTKRNESGRSASSSNESVSTMGKEKRIREKLPWYRRPHPAWLVFSATSISLVLGMTMAPKIELYTRLVCEAISPDGEASTSGERKAVHHSGFSIIDGSSYHEGNKAHNKDKRRFESWDEFIKLGSDDPSLDEGVGFWQRVPQLVSSSMGIGIFSPSSLQTMMIRDYHHNPSRQLSARELQGPNSEDLRLNPPDHLSSNNSYPSPLPSSSLIRNVTSSHPLTPSQCRQSPLVQRSVARLNIILTLLTGILSSLTTTHWGRFSDLHGRKPVLFVALFGLMSAESTIVLVVRYKDWLLGVDLNNDGESRGGYTWLVVGPIVDGLCGGIATAASCINAYIADCTSIGSRARIFSIMHSLFFVGLALGPFLGSIAIRALTRGEGTDSAENGTLLTPFYLATVVLAFQLILVLLVLPESSSKERREDAKRKSRMENEQWVLSSVGAGSGVTGGLVDWFKSGSLAIFKPFALFWPRKVEYPPIGTGRKHWNENDDDDDEEEDLELEEEEERQLESHGLSSVGPGRRDWNLLWIGLAFALFITNVAIYQIKALYTQMKFDWGAESIGLYLSFAGTCRAIALLIIVPTIIRYFKKPAPIPPPLSKPSSVVVEPPNPPPEDLPYSAATLDPSTRAVSDVETTNNVISGHSDPYQHRHFRGKSLSSTPLAPSTPILVDVNGSPIPNPTRDNITIEREIEEARRLEDEARMRELREAALARETEKGNKRWTAKAKKWQVVHDAHFDLTLARFSCVADALSYLLISLAQHPIPFLLATALQALAGGAMPALNSLALSMSSAADAGRTLASFGVLQSIMSQILGPLIFGSIYSASVGTFPEAIFIVAFSLFLSSTLVLLLVRLPKLPINPLKFGRPTCHPHSDEDEESPESENLRPRVRVPRGRSKTRRPALWKGKERREDSHGSTRAPPVDSGFAEDYLG